MRYDADHLLSLIPAIYKVRDAIQDAEPHGPMEALVDAIAAQVSGVELNIEQLYDDLFIETCADWVVPYLGDLIGYTSLSGNTAAVRSPRAEVANTIGYRRRKGTLTVLEMLAADVTGWPAVARESFQSLAQTQYLNHLRPARTSTLSVRSPLPSLADNQFFLDLPYNVDVRRIGSGRGVWNIPNIAIYLYRLACYSITGGTPGSPVPAVPQGYTFDPLGRDTPLFQPVRGLTADQAHTDLPQNVPGRASRRLLYAELEQRRQLLGEAVDPDVIEEEAVGFTEYDPVVRIAIGGVAIDPQFLSICDLSEWTPSSIAGIQASVDPQLGRFMLSADPGIAAVTVDYNYGFPGEFGAGDYVRDNPPAKTELTADNALDSAIATALLAGDADVRVTSSATFAGDLGILLDPGQKLTLRAASRTRPAIGGKLTVTLGAGSALTLTGFLIGGGMVIEGDAGTVLIDGCSIPGPVPALSWVGTDGGMLTLTSTLAGSLQIDPLVALSVANSVIDAGDDGRPSISAVDGAPAGSLSLDCVTVIGTVSVREIGLVQNSLITGTLTSTRTQGGCVRFSYLTADSTTPRRYECQPETAIATAVATAKAAGASNAAIAALTSQITARIKPDFTSLDPANPAYAQLGQRCAAEIAAGAEDGLEMGVYQSLQQPAKESNLRLRVAEYLRIGLETGIFFAD